MPRSLRVDFTEPNEDIAFEGLSGKEPWGRWSDTPDANVVKMTFGRPLPREFTMALTAVAYGPNEQQDFHAIVGQEIKSFRITNPGPNTPPNTLLLDFSNNVHADSTLTITIPQPISPLSRGESADSRALGIGLFSLIIQEKSPSYSQFYKLPAQSLTDPSFAVHKADVCFEVEKLADHQLHLIGREKGKIVFEHTQALPAIEALQQRNFRLTKIDDNLIWDYKGQDGSQFAIQVTHKADIVFLLPAIEARTHYESKKRWGFKTSGNLLNVTDSCFYFLYLQASQIHSFGLLKCLCMDAQQSYFFNKGVVHLGDETGIASREIYIEYFPLIDQGAEPRYQADVIDDYGVTIAEKGLKVGHMNLRVHKLVDTHQLELDEAPVEVLQELTVTGPIIGSTPRITNRACLNAGSIDSSLSLQDWVNHGDVWLSNISEIHTHNELDNKGLIRGFGSLTLSSRKKPKSLGTMISDDEIKAIINDILTPEERELVFKGAQFYSKKRRIVIEAVQHTDHYLNTITNHYIQGQYGQRLSHTTQTGYVFQKRTTERKQKVIETDALMVPEEMEAIDRAALQRQFILIKLRHELKDRIRTLMRFYNSAEGIQDVNWILASVLAEMGLETEEVKDIVEDVSLQSLLLALGLPEREALKLVEANDFQLKPLYNSILIDAMRLGVSALDWVKNHPHEFMDVICGAAPLLSTVPHPYAQCSARVVNSLCGLRGAQKNLPKIQAYFSKRHDSNAGTSGSSGSQPSLSSGQVFYVPPRVQSRINIIEGTSKVDTRTPNSKKPGIEKVWRKHMNSDKTNKSQFTISREEVRSIITDKKTVQTPITRMGYDGTYVREVKVEKVVGKLPADKGGSPTFIVTIHTDKEGNLVNVYPGPFIY